MLRNWIAGIVASWAIAAPAWAADTALLVTNTNYRALQGISDTGGSPDSLAAAYRQDGYEVTDLRNLDASGLASALRTFEAGSRDADRVVIHFTGHVASSELNLRLAPVGVGTSTLVDAAYSAPAIDLLYELLSHRPGRSALILAGPDAGLPALIESGPDIPQGILVVSGAPDRVNPAIRDLMLGRNLPATGLSEAGVGLHGFVSDIPIASMGSDIVPILPEIVAAPTPSADERAWTTAQRSGSEAAFRRYLQNFPRGEFAAEARRRIAALVPPAKAAEDALGLTRTERIDIQRSLTAIGYNTRGIDGIFGAGTRSAITRWQANQGFDNTGFLTAPQLRTLSRQGQSALAAAERQRAREAEQRRATQAAEQRRANQAAARQAQLEDRAFWQRTGANGSARGLNRYLERYPDGIFADEAKAQLQALAQKQAIAVGGNAQLKKVEDGLGLTPRMRLLAEQRLRASGFNPGQVDGLFTAETRVALKKFQAAKGLNATGYVDRRTVTALIVTAFR